MAVGDLRGTLSGGARSSVGEADRVIQALLTDPSGLDGIYRLFLDDDPVVAMRASYVAMRVAEKNPQSVAPYRDEVLANLELFTQQEIRWHVPQLLVHVDLSSGQRRRAYEVVM